jgi:16S rRNA (guanine527-N7)-methyltransferase
MREPAHIPTAAGKTETPPAGASFVSGPIDAASSAARRAREALEADLESVPGLSALLTTSMLDRLEAYVGLLLEANERMNLTRIVEPAEIARLHLLDALAALPLLDELAPRIAVDLGSGGGVPAIPLAIARPEISWVLIDSVGKKARALAGFVETLGLSKVEVMADRAETIGRTPKHREQADLVTARALAALPILAELALPLLRPGGQLLAWKGSLTEDDEEVRRGERAAARLGGGTLEVIVPGLAQLEGHTFVRVTKRGLTDERYPRRPGEPERRPLG